MRTEILTLIAVATILALPTGNAFKSSPSVAHLRRSSGEAAGTEERLKYYVYTRANLEVPESLEPDVESVIRNVYTPHKRTVISIHEWRGNKDSAENQAIVRAKLEQTDCNVVVADYSAAFPDTPNYDEVVASAPDLGAVIADFVLLLHIYFDVPLEQFHLVGFGVGAQIAGFVGQSLFERTGGKVQRITALDPAGPLYNTTSTLANAHLSPDDAHFVEVVHTNGNGLGYTTPCGHADYYPNGGRTQPNCDVADAECSHERAVAFIGEMWSAGNDFVTTKCATYEQMNLEHCRWVNVRMGQERTQHGLFYLETNEEYPYGKGSYVYTYL